MTKEEIVEMYVDWATGDDKIKMSDWMVEAFDSGIDLEEIEKIGKERIKKLETPASTIVADIYC